MYTRTTNSIKVTATPEYVESQSSPFEEYFVWSYRINIKNKSTEPIQLIRRHWKIIDSNGRVQEVSGAGVVGVQPTLAPGEEFEYSSGTHLNTSSGVMMGNYEMSTGDGRIIDVEIPPFSLDCPHIKPVSN